MLVCHRLVSRFAGKVFASDPQDAFTAFAIEFDTRDDVPSPFDRGVGHGDHVTQKTLQALLAVGTLSKLNVRCRRGRAYDARETVHNP